MANIGKSWQDQASWKNRPSNYLQSSTSAQVKVGDGILCGLIVSSTSSGTLKIWDNTSATGNVIVNTITPAAGAVIDCKDVEFETGLYVQTTNTIQYTVFYK